jgi:acylphosphatase
MEQSAKHIIFSGRVQGVGFRFTALNVANRYMLKGIVRNLPDGTVEMIAQGPAEDIDSCIEDIKESYVGNVREARVQETCYNPQYEDFKITF